MVVPLVARYIAAVAGVLIVLGSARSIIGTLIVPAAGQQLADPQGRLDRGRVFRLIIGPDPRTTGAGTGCWPARWRPCCWRRSSSGC